MTNGDRVMVLIADDLPDVLAKWTRELAVYGVETVSASTLTELDSVFNMYRGQLAAVILDGCIPGHELNTVPFIVRVRAEGFGKPIVASSSLLKYRQQMVRAGASHEAGKDRAAELVVNLLSTP